MLKPTSQNAMQARKANVAARFLSRLSGSVTNPGSPIHSDTCWLGSEQFGIEPTAN
jgi:hypothetical protein